MVSILLVTYGVLGISYLWRPFYQLPMVSIFLPVRLALLKTLAEEQKFP